MIPIGIKIKLGFPDGVWKDIFFEPIFVGRDTSESYGLLFSLI
jgi:hypothetical protein